MLTLASHESGLSARIASGHCRPDECDQGRAWGVLQVHRYDFNASVWGSTNLDDQVREGARIARSKAAQCERAGVPFPLGVFRAMGGRKCRAKLKDEKRRMATYHRVLAELR